MVIETAYRIYVIEQKKSVKTLAAQGRRMAAGNAQIALLESTAINGFKHLTFKDRLKEINAFPLQPTGIEIFQINLGKMCNQVCKHCHVDAGPDRREIMTPEVMRLCLAAIKKSGATEVDL